MSSRKRRLICKGMEIKSSILQKFGDIEIMREKAREIKIISQVRCHDNLDTTSMKVS